MPRNRIIKADFWADEKIGKLSLLTRLLFIGTWNFADDSGVCRANEIYLRNNIFPYDDLTLPQVKEAVKELCSSGVVVLLESSGERYLRIMNFQKHQTINKPSNFRYIKDSEAECSSSVVVVKEQSPPKVKEKVKEKVNRGVFFQKPSLEEVKQYCIERKNNVNPEAFINHYESKGWMVGKSPMKDWKAAVGTWELNTKPKGGIPDVYNCFA